MGEHDEIAKRRKHHKHAPEPPLVPQAAPAPGKATGVPIVDAGVYCDHRPTAPGCDPALTETDRTRLLVALSTVAGNAMGAYRDAIQNLRIELLTMFVSSTSWGAVAEGGFLFGTTGIIGLLAKSLGGELVSAAKLTAVLTTASKSLRTFLKNAAHHSGLAKGAGAAADFLTGVQDQIPPVANTLVLDAPASLTDLELRALIAAYQDPKVHSVAAYTVVLRDLVARFGDQRLDEIGDGRSNGTDRMTDKKAVHVIAGGRSRVAILHYFNKAFDDGAKKLREGESFAGGGHLVPWGATEFISWVDDDLADAALAAQMKHYGAPQILDASRADTGMTQVDEWAKASSP